MNYYGDYIGFQFGEYHSRDLGLYRVSESNRYTDMSTPNFTDTTSQKTGGDGTYYWDSFYTQRQFTIQCAFDDVSEKQLRQIRQIFNGKTDDWLVFDEMPFKKYRVKLSQPPQIKYLTFREEPDTSNETKIFNKPRVYKGEMTLQFISYTPYAIDNFKTYDYVNNEVSNDYPNIDEWYESAQLLSKAQMDELEGITSLDSGNYAAYFVYNPGDQPTSPKIVINATAVPSNLNVYMMRRAQSENKPATSSVNDQIVGELHFEGLTIDTTKDYKVVIDTATNLVYGIRSLDDSQSGTLYNRYLTSGEFFKIPISQEAVPSYYSTAAPSLVDYCDYVWINVPRPSNGSNCAIEYNYLYY